MRTVAGCRVESNDRRSVAFDVSDPRGEPPGQRVAEGDARRVVDEVVALVRVADVVVEVGAYIVVGGGGPVTDERSLGRSLGCVGVGVGVGALVRCGTH